MQQLNCVVTGSEGYIGRVLMKSLAESGQFGSVIGLDKTATAALVADITDPIDVGGELDGHFDICVHLAAVAKEPGHEHGEYYDVNHRGTVNVLGMCDQLGIPTVIFVSTMMVFPAGEFRYNEGCQVAPDTAYGGSKALAERDILAWESRGNNRRVVVIRPGVVFGMDDNGNFDRMRRALAVGRFAYVGRRDTIKSCVHVRDVVGFIMEAMSRSDLQGVYHLAFPDSTRIDEIVEATQRSFGISRRVYKIPYRFALALSALFRIFRIVNSQNFHPRRIQKLNRSTNIAADRWLASGYKMHHPTLAEACTAWSYEVGA
jgi:GlcNAc-P-P-Und epimerase